MISQAAEYALQATVFLAETDRTEPVSVGELAEALGAPRNYLSKILGTLARAGVLSSLRGPTGGFTLAVPAESLELSRIVGLFDPPPGRRCLLGRPQCSDANPCAAHPLWSVVAERIDGFFRQTTIAQLLEASSPAVSAGVASGGQREKGDGGRGRTAPGGRGRTRPKEVKNG